MRRFAAKHGGLIRYEYSLLPNVVNVRGLPRQALDALRRVPGVLRIEEDQKVHAHMDDSAPLIRALQTQISRLGQTGQHVPLRNRESRTGSCQVDGGAARIPAMPRRKPGGRRWYHVRMHRRSNEGSAIQEMRDVLLDLKATEYGCPASTFLERANCLLAAAPDGLIFRMVGFGHGTVVLAHPSLEPDLAPFFAREDGIFCFDAPQLCTLNSILRKHGHRLGEIYDTYLPTELTSTGVGYSGDATIVKLGREELSRLEWSEEIENAISAPGSDNKDEFAYVAEVDAGIAAIAGTSSNYPGLWSVGVDTSPEHRGRGLASHLVSLVTRDVLALGIVPFYSTWYSNLGSRATALRCGYRPACVEILSTEEG